MYTTAYKNKIDADERLPSEKGKMIITTAKNFGNKYYLRHAMVSFMDYCVAYSR